MLQVRLTSDDIPAATVVAYSWFANVNIGVVRGDVTGSGSGYAKQADNTVAAFTQSPKFSTNANALNVPHYFQSILFSSSSIANFYLHQSITV